MKRALNVLKWLVIGYAALFTLGVGLTVLEQHSPAVRTFLEVEHGRHFERP
jgi:hypothetical protein